jgi:hypothetical protein
MNGRNFLKPSEISVETQDAAQIKVNIKKLTNQNNYKRLSDFEVIFPKPLYKSRLLFTISQYCPCSADNSEGYPNIRQGEGIGTETFREKSH